MKSILLAAVLTGFAIGAAQADCNYHKSVSAEQVDQTKVASVAVPQSQPAEAPAPPAMDDGEQ
jgi:hypothetical protein